MIIDSLGINKTVNERLKTLETLKELNRSINFQTISEYEKMPEIAPIDNQLHFFQDGIEAIFGVEKNATDKDLETYHCVIVDEKRKRIIKYSFEGKNYRICVKIKEES